MADAVPGTRLDPVVGRAASAARPGTGGLPPVMSSGGGSPRKRRRGRSVVRSLPLVPAAVLLAVFLIGPIISAFTGSFTNSSLSGATAQQSSFVGLSNYTALFQNPVFPSAVIVTVIFVLASSIVGQNIVGLGLAIVMRAANRYVQAVVGTIVVAAWVLPEVVAAFASYAFYRQDGSLNEFLHVFGITGPDWLYVYPLLTVIFANIWRGTAFSMLVYSAALSDVPPEITEAAEVDGASGFKRLTLVTLPMIRRTIATNSMIITLQTLSVFTLIYVMTAGGPGNASTTLPILAYQQAFKFGQIGYGTAIATMLLIIGAIFSIVYIRALQKESD